MALFLSSPSLAKDGALKYGGFGRLFVAKEFLSGGWAF